MSSRLLSKTETAARLSASMSSINRWLAQGLIASVHLGGRVLIPESEIDRITSIARPFGAVAAPAVAVAQAEAR